MFDDVDLIADRYRLIARAGSGGMGVVWRARDEVLGREVALKELIIQPGVSMTEADEAVHRALREARIAARLNHRNVIGVYDVAEHDGRPFLVMEYFHSRSLADLMADGFRPTASEVARIGSEAAAALAAAHDAGIVHRDVKPGNVLIAEDGQVKLTDFGISRAEGDSTVTASGIVLGTASFLAPEVARGLPADSRSDVYALGATLYAVVEGEPPFGSDANPIAVLYRASHEDVPPPRAAGALAPPLMRMLDRDAARRPTMQQAGAELRAIADADGQPARDPLRRRIAPFTRDRRPTATGGAGSVVAIGAGAGAGDNQPKETAVLGDGREGLAATAGKRLDAIAHSATDGPGIGIATPAGDEMERREPIVSGKGSRRRAVVGGGIVVLVALLAVVTTLTMASRGGPRTPSAASSTSGHAPPTTSAHQGATTVSPAKPSAAASSAAAQLPSSGSAQPRSSPTAPSTSQGVADQLNGTIIDYYHLVPGNLDQAWGWMTADYQQNHAGGRANYNAFWQPVQRVTVTDVVASPPSDVDATVVYYYRDGHVVQERTRFGLVRDQGQWKIAQSSVLSSTGG